MQTSSPARVRKDGAALLPDPRTRVMPDRRETDPPLRLTLRPDQQDAVDNAVRHLNKPHRRGHMVRACGTGKTVIALRTADALQARRLVVVVPSLDLIAQWATASRADGRTEPKMAVCSLKTSRHPVLAEARVATTNSPDLLAAWLAREKGKATVFVTLDSLTKLEQTQHTRSPAPVFDLLVVDEAHRTAGSWNKEWTAVHDDYRIRAERRLYLTATPYEWHGPRLTEDPATDHIVPKPTAATAPEWDAPARLATMDQIATFGPRLHTYSHADAINDGVLADYQLVIPPSPKPTCANSSPARPRTRPSDRPPAAPPPCTWRSSKRCTSTTCTT